MRRNRNIIITLTVIIVILTIALVCAMIYIFTNTNKQTNNTTNAGNTSNVNNVDNSENTDNNENTVENSEEPNLPDDTTTNEQEPDDEPTDDNVGMATFNNNFISYLGNISGEKFNKLLEVIENCNEKYPNHQVTIKSTTIHSLDEIIETETYTIKFMYDDNGYINIIIIDKKTI